MSATLKTKKDERCQRSMEERLVIGALVESDLGQNVSPIFLSL